MTRWGVGPRFTVLSLLYAVLVFAVQNTVFSEIRFVIYLKLINMILGILLTVTGFFVFVISAFTVDKYYFKGKLCKKGVYAYLRHPIYGSWISFIMPGIVILRGSALGVTIPIFMYLVYRSLIPIEEKYLIDKFGDEYLDYKSKVWAVFPRLFSPYK